MDRGGLRPPGFAAARPPEGPAIRLALTVPLCGCALYVAGFLACALAPHGGPADIAVVLGNEVLADGSPSPRLAARVDAAAEAYRAGLVPLILVSGGTGANGFDEADAMRGRLLRDGVPDSAILTDPDGADTMATASRAARVMRERGLSRALVVSQWFHIPRCVVAFRKAGIATVRATYPAYLERRDLYSAVRELVAIPYYAAFRRPA